LGLVEELRRRDEGPVRILGKGGEAKPMAHIRPTPNNPSSSRGTLFIFLTLTFMDAEKTQGQIVIVDMAGMEAPSTMVQTYLRVRPVFPPEAPTDPETQEMRRSLIHDEEEFPACVRQDQAFEPNADKKFIAENMWQLGDEEFLKKIGECIEFREILDKETCVKKPATASCFDIEVEGKDMRVRVQTKPDPTFLTRTSNVYEESDRYPPLRLEFPHAIGEAQYMKREKN
jgi:hypothetical protein